ncbi:TonB-dependent receptor plug [Fibrella aestuarina BUZ 2]|uniref:TonB-dependent receptor plug n=1 Tax=Fibrella aestuarina BUZ 2 TaxID=1166018 RepID=I0K415_9BACT|nr:TonB-dependent receptor [Fibrella aestuarina]CCG98868.1 TonB-dependent receptor plug [Fibrella aestuarina BUZ 2]
MNRLSTLFLTLSLLLVSLSAWAHLGRLAGTVIDQATQLPLRGATVQLTGLGRSTTTNELGQFVFDRLPPSPYKLEVTYLGYTSVTIDLTILDDETTTVSIPLGRSTLELREVVVSAGKTQGQQLISAIDITTRPIVNSQEILRLVPGLFIGQHAGGGKAEQIFLRGFDLDHGTDIRLTVDGMPVNMVSHAHGQGYADLHFVIPELVAGVSFKKGPYETDKGNLTTAGWADFRTKTVLDRSFAKVEIGQYNTYRTVFSVNLIQPKPLSPDQLRRDQSAYVAGEYSYSDSYFENPQRFNRINLLGKYHRHLSPTTDLTLTGSTFWSRWNHSGQIPDRAVDSRQIGFFGSIDPTEGGETSRTNANLELVTVTPGQTTIKNQFFYSRYTFELYSNFTFFLNDSINGDQIRQREKRHLFGYNGIVSHTYRLGNRPLTAAAGLQYRQDITGDEEGSASELSHTVNRTETLERLQFGSVNERNAAAYADATLELSDRFTLNAGVRLDYFQNRYLDLIPTERTWQQADAAIVSPKLNLYYTLNPSLQLYLNTGKGFHSNDTRVVVAQRGRQILPPAYGSDLGLIVKPLPNLLINAAGWYLWLQQEFVWVGDEGVVEPSGRSRRYGLDLSARYQLARNLYADVDLNTATPRSLDAEAGQNYLPLAPTFTSTGGLSLQRQTGFSGSLRYRYMADRPANEDRSIMAKGYFVTDMQVNYARRQFTLGLSLQNLFNTRWKETQFATESRLRNEATAVNEIHFTPGTPFFARLSATWFW